MLTVVAEAAGIPAFYLGIAMAVSVALAAAAGVLRRGLPLGQRLALGERPQILLTIGGVGLMAWAAVPLTISATVPHARQEPTSPGVLALGNGAAELATLIALAAATLLLRPGGWRRLGLGLSRLPAGLLGGILGILIVLPWVFWSEVATQQAWSRLHLPHEAAHQLLLALGNTSAWWLRVVIVVTAVAVAPLAEEMFFRGHIQTFLRYGLKRPWPAIVLAALAFAAVHPWWMSPPIFLLGLCLGYAYERTGNLWTNVTMHALFNLTSIVIYARFSMPG
jgi:membrane protease YdiL (CAAX protease family)